MEQEIKVYKTKDHKRKIKVKPLSEEESWEMRFNTLPELLGKISDKTSVRNPERFRFIKDLNKFIDKWK